MKLFGYLPETALAPFPLAARNLALIGLPLRLVDAYQSALLT
jgi:hypothetical protein